MQGLHGQQQEIRQALVADLDASEHGWWATVYCVLLLWQTA